MSKILLLAAMLAAALAAQERPNFSGSWELQVARSDFGPMPAPESQTYTVSHQDPKLHIKMNAKGAQGEQIVERRLTTDGEENTNEVGGRTWKSKTTWVEKQLVTETEFEFGGNPMKLRDNWRLSEDGKTFTIDRTFRSVQGEATQKLVYTKK